jgi:hypothetical protein
VVHAGSGELPCHFGERFIEVDAVSNPFQQQKIDHGDPDLRENGILGSAKECFDLEVLLNPTEERFNVPPPFVDFSDVRSRQTKFIG